MYKKNIYIAQFGTGANVNLLPLAAGQLVSRLKQETELLKSCNICEIISRRQDPSELISNIDDVFIIGLSCYLWNMNISIKVAKAVREKHQNALIVTGGPAIPKDRGFVDEFFRQHPYIDVICKGEGEEVFVALCNQHLQKECFDTINGIIYRDRKTGIIHDTGTGKTPSLEALPSPYLDGTFDDLYKKYSQEYSGIVWETNRGCPYQCTFCICGNDSSKIIREKTMDQIKSEIEWMGRNKIGYIAMGDSNFGIRKRDLEIAMLLAECKRKHGFPTFISTSWAKNSSEKVLEIGEVLKQSGIGFKVTLSLQSLNDEVIKAIKRDNIKDSEYKKIKDAYNKKCYYSYTELILALPLETYESFLSGIEMSLGGSIFDQLYVYPCYIIPNTEMATMESRKKYGIETKITAGGYTKSKGSYKTDESAEIVIGTSAMSKEKWVDSFVMGNYILALHDNRLAFFILQYLKKRYDIKIIDFILYVKKECKRHNLSVLKRAFMRLEDCAKGVQQGKTHLIEPIPYGGMCFDPSEAIFLELLYERDNFYSELLFITELYLNSCEKNYDKSVLQDLYIFQKTVMAHPNGPITGTLRLQYNWINFFLFTFNLGERELVPMQDNLNVVDCKPSNGNIERFLENHFNVRGVPVFNQISNDKGEIQFPPRPLR